MRRGLDLRLARIRAGIKQTEIAAVLGVGKKAVSLQEHADRVSERYAQRYMQALETLRRSR